MSVENTEKVAGPVMVSPKVIAVLVAGTVYMWAEALFRYLMTNTPMGGWFFLYPQRTGDVVAMWLTISIIGVVTYLILHFFVLKKPKSVKTYTLWIMILSVSVIIAPFVGEIGTSWGI